MKFKSIAFLLMTIAMPAMAEQVSVNSKGISLILDVENGKPAQYLYFGSKLNAADLQNLTSKLQLPLPLGEVAMRSIGGEGRSYF